MAPSFSHELPYQFAVIFTATLTEMALTDPDYVQLAKQCRDLAFNHYGCVQFHSTLEGREEIALSYWNDLHHIQQWKKDPLHQQAQALGREKWYERYSVDVVQIHHHYQQNLGRLV